MASSAADWTRFADAVLLSRVEAVRAAGLTPSIDPVAGLVVPEDAAALIKDLGPALKPTKRPSRSWAVADPLAAAREQFSEALAQPTVFSAVVANAELSPPEAEVLALAAAVELDPVRQRTVAYLHGNVALTRPTLHLVGELFGDGHPGPITLGPDGRLRRAALVSVGVDGPWSQRSVTVAESVLWSVVGDSSLDPDLPIGARVIEASDPGGMNAPLIVVVGDDRGRRLQAAVSHTIGSQFLLTPAPVDDAGWGAVVREATVSGLAVIVESEDRLTPAARRWIERADHLAWCLSTRYEPDLAGLPDVPSVQRRAAPGLAADDEVAAVLGDDVPTGHRITVTQLRDLARIADRRRDPAEAIRRLSSGPLDRLTRRVRPRRGWGDLVLTAEQEGQLRELVARFEHRAVVHDQWGIPAIPSAGLVALLVGPSGTGKTTAAEIVAGALGLDLFAINLAAVVSKYIGETEQNLERIFDAAAAGHLVLLFDEADSLFGKRSEVNDARDRYANIEVSYLLQRLEAYDGLAVLTTNFARNIDDAFLRRLHAKIEFGLPGVGQRRGIWEHSLAAGAPLGDIDLDYLAEHFEVAGGAIHNAALTAAFLAAEGGTAVDMAHIARGLRREYQKLSKRCTEADFGPWFHLVAPPAAEARG
jgi:hypothetical protein